MEQKGLDFEAGPVPPVGGRRALTVRELTERIQGVLETEFVDVWVEGQVSNLKMPESGHMYFSLKDEQAQIRAVVWRADARLLRFRPKDGMQVLARGSVRVYAPRGDYQISIQALEPLGKGSLQQAFEELKERLEGEGLFDRARKRPLPLLPRRIGVVTSPSGAVIRDILRVLRSRYANLEVLVYPARVQGTEAAAEIVQGIETLNALGSLDVLLLARGGGSLEDLWPFNEEIVARAIAASRIPTMSAVGHETDVTIADFVADVRAPTPSAAAEMVVKAKTDLESRIDGLTRRCLGAVQLRVERVRSRLRAAAIAQIFTAEERRLQGLAQRTDEFSLRTRRAMERRMERSGEALRSLSTRLASLHWRRQVTDRRERIGDLRDRLTSAAKASLELRRSSVLGVVGRLHGLSPLAVLSRGYALVWREVDGRLLRSADKTAIGDILKIRVHEGRLVASVTAKETS